MDKKGVDMGFVIPGDVFPVVIQCKGFEVTADELRDGHVEQVAKSVRKFGKSGLKCKRYIILSNRSGRNRVFAKGVESKLGQLVSGGVAIEALLWTLDDLVKALERHLTAGVIDALRRWSDQVDRERSKIFSFDEVVIDDVPAVKRRWRLHVGAAQGQIEADQPIAPSQLIEELLIPTQGRFSLVIGAYGMGKTTLMRNLKLPAGYTRLLVPAANLLHVVYSGGSQTALLEHLLQHTGCLQDLADASGIAIKELQRVGGACLGDAVQSTDLKAVLIIDGLDENRIYSRADGFRRLAGELRRLRIPVIVTTRKEHFFNRYLELQPQEQQVWLSRAIETTVIELTDWSTATCNQMLDRVASLTDSNRRALDPLRVLLDQRRLPLVAGHPLWLAMAIDLALAGDMQLFDNQRALYSEWTQRKFMRDFSAPGRDLPKALSNLAIFVQKLTDVMTAIAARMCSVENGSLGLKAEIDDVTVEAVAREHIPTAERLDPLFAESSLLTPSSIRSTSGMQMRFSHFSFQEFFTARAIEIELISVADSELPVGVGAFLERR
ncbi:hypothetical protein ASE11_18590 [Hydrogenophaga sp. Root209]|nr:hypothetical protein ASE11_18590 [Hydrogenophaga sp. Root209]